MQKRMMGGILSGDDLPELIWHIIGERAGERDQQHRHIARQNEGIRSACSKRFFIARPFPRLALFKKPCQHLRRRQKQHCRDDQRKHRIAAAVMLRLPAKRRKQRIYSPTEQARRLFSSAKPSEHLCSLLRETCRLRSTLRQGAVPCAFFLYPTRSRACNRISVFLRKTKQTR